MSAIDAIKLFVLNAGKKTMTNINDHLSKKNHLNYTLSMVNASLRSLIATSLCD